MSIISKIISSLSNLMQKSEENHYNKSQRGMCATLHPSLSSFLTLSAQLETTEVVRRPLHTPALPLSHPSCKHEIANLRMNVNTAFLYNILDVEIYIEQPEGFVDPEHLDWPQASSKNLAPCEFLKSISFVQSSTDQCIYIKFEGGEKCIITLYVNDLLITTLNKQLLVYIKSKLSQHFHKKLMDC